MRASYSYIGICQATRICKLLGTLALDVVAGVMLEGAAAV
jgi:hypothetical protein